MDVGGGAGYFMKAFRAAGADCFAAEPDWSELSWRGTAPEGAVLGDGYRLPFRTSSADLVLSSNVLEHVGRPYEMIDELTRRAPRWAPLDLVHELVRTLGRTRDVPVALPRSRTG